LGRVGLRFFSFWWVGLGCIGSHKMDPRTTLSAIIHLLKKYFPFSHAEPFGYDNSPNKGTVKFSGNKDKK